MNRFALTILTVATLTTACGGASKTVTTADAPATQAGAPAADTTGAAAAESTEVDAGVLVDAAWATTEAGSSRSSFQAEVPVSGSDDVTFGGEGSVDFATQRGSLDLDISQLVEAAGIDGVDGSFDMVFDANVTYLRAPLLTELFAAQTPWMQYDVAALPKTGSSSFGDGLNGLTQFAGHDPLTPLNLLTGAIPGTVERAGTETVRDADATRYTARIDLAKALATTPAPVRERLIDRLGVDELEVEAFLDADGRLVRLAYAEGDAASAATVEYEYFDFGTDASVSIPAADQISNLFDVLPPF